QEAIEQVVAIDKARGTQDFPSLETKKPAQGRFFHPNGQRTESLRTGLSSEFIITHSCTQYKANHSNVKANHTYVKAKP
ncbi:hypothetical protein ABFV57_34225, partial [Pseudomonas neuropathica]|uniref:hypothetical protein n=1 Tax=Pseudomonas neuropathica TaxID=2730425 RepID=UPI0034D6CF77